MQEMKERIEWSFQEVIEMDMTENTGTIYRKAKLWQIILVAMNALNAMAVYQLVGMASYSASIGYGVSTAVIGAILTGTRIFDGITDPLLAFVYDRVNTRFGKVRVILVTGFVIEAVALMAMFDWCSSKGLNWIAFTLLYIVYVIGYTMANMTVQTIPALITNDPKQRPTVGVWFTAFNYLVPMALSILFNSVMLPMFGNEYNQAHLSAVVKVVIAVSAVGVFAVCIGVSAYDKPEYFEGIGKHERLKFKDMWDVLAHNQPLQCYIAAQASDKIAQITVSQSIIVTMLYGIVIGNMSYGTILSVTSMLPSIIFAVFGARYAGKHGSRKGIVTWTRVCIVFAILSIAFFLLIPDTTAIAKTGSLAMILYFLLTLALNGSKMCVTTCASSFMADVIDYELDRSGRYVPAVVTGTYSLIDKLISSFGALIATGCVALIGYRASVPQPTDELTTGVFAMTIGLEYALPIVGWIITLIAMRGCRLDKKEMEKVQERIAEKKKAVREAEG